MSADDLDVAVGIAIGVCGFAWFVVFVLGFEAGIRRYGRQDGPPNERRDPRCVGWKTLQAPGPSEAPWSDND
jgi:hypothetical protein